MYTDIDFPSAAALKRALKAGARITYYQPGLGSTPTDGTVYLEGPHYPRPHSWYAKATVQNGIIVKVQ